MTDKLSDRTARIYEQVEMLLDSMDKLEEEHGGIAARHWWIAKSNMRGILGSIWGAKGALMMYEEAELAREPRIACPLCQGDGQYNRRLCPECRGERVTTASHWQTTQVERAEFLRELRSDR